MDHDTRSNELQKFFVAIETDENIDCALEQLFFMVMWFLLIVGFEEVSQGRTIIQGSPTFYRGYRDAQQMVDKMQLLRTCLDA
ncbi:unnamed protein product [Arabidopsis halleri]